ncbi:MAG: hypothetical protein GAK38_00433 [Xylophilus sp.]|nr:MAG: hypothetical protein GAK38_00433 [Xylophilus sp.]
MSIGGGADGAVVGGVIKSRAMAADSAPSSFNLTHHFLIAMPGLRDETFARSVIYLCEHSERGALGLMINKPSEINMRHLFDKVDLSLRRDDLTDAPVLQGGPVQTERGFVLHEPMSVRAASAEGEAGIVLEEGEADPPENEPAYASTMAVPGGLLEMTTSKDVLEAIATGAGPRRVLVTLGYASWGEGQLESEIAENSWLTVGADLSVIFDTPVGERYERALSLLGLQPWMLLSEAGHA